MEKFIDCEKQITLYAIENFKNLNYNKAKIQAQNHLKKSQEFNKNYTISQREVQNIIFLDLRNQAESYVEYFSTNVTGIRSGEIIIGNRTISKDTIIKVEGEIPPDSELLNIIRLFPDLWYKLLRKLEAIKFFRNFSFLEIENWLDKNAIPNDFDISERATSLEILQLGSGSFTSLNEDHILELLSSRKFSGKYIRDMFPRKVGSNARRHTLVFLRSFWNISTIFSTTSKAEGLVLNVDGTIHPNGYIVQNDEIIYTFESNQFNIITKTNSISDYYKILWEMFPLFKSELEFLNKSINTFTPAAFKSFIQKIIRFRPTFVEMEDYNTLERKKFPSEFILVFVIVKLASNPGSFVPDIQRFVSGLESCAKRIAISIFEDGYPMNSSVMLSMLISTYMAQRTKIWKPSTSVFKGWINAALFALKSTKYITWNIERGNQIHFSEDIFEMNLNGDENFIKYKLCSLFLDQVKSLGSDYGMVRDIANTYPDWIMDKDPSAYENKIMPSIHCVDQHWIPDLAYYYKPKVIKELVSGPNPFEGLFSNIWNKLSGINARKKKFDICDPFVIETRRAQRLLMIARQSKKSFTNLKYSSTFKLKYKLDDGWLAGMIGAIQISGNPNCIVTLNPSNIQEMTVLKKPSIRKSNNNSILSKQKELQSLQEAKIKLKKGIVLNSSNSPIPELKGKKVFLKKSKYYIGNKIYSSDQEWNEIKCSILNIPEYPKRILSYKNAIIHRNNGMIKGGFAELTSFLNKNKIVYIHKALIYLNGYRSIIELNKISRDGGGINHAVNYEDVCAFNILMLISVIFPSALQLKESRTITFVVSQAPLLWKIRDIMIDHIESFEKNKNLDQNLWGNIYDRLGRNLWGHQRDVVLNMIDKKTKGHILWIPTGMGKTAIVLTYLQRLLESNKLPKYIIYTLPSSATKSIIHEIQAFNFGINFIVPLVNNKKYIEGYPNIKITKKKEPEPYVINLIEHDHLRKCQEDFFKIMSQSFLIVDEVHKALNNSKRTSICLELSRLSLNFVAMTGTLVIDSEIYKLIWWIEQIVKFEVNVDNFWVAVNDIVSKKINTKVDVDSKELEINLTFSEDEKYKKLIPPALGGINSMPSGSDFKQALDLSYQVVTRGIINETLTFIKEGKGVFVVAQNKSHQHILYNLFIEQGVSDKDIFLISKDNTIFLTDESKENYKIVITPQRKAEGYTLTKLQVMITGVYPSNQATRTQLEGRINRISQNNKKIYFRTIHAGILTHILEKHSGVKNIEDALRQLAKDI